MEHQWNIYGTPMEYLWNIVTPLMHARCMGDAWVTDGGCRADASRMEFGRWLVSEWEAG
jgi:hypothetical protein